MSDGQTIQGSTAILDHLEDLMPDSALTSGGPTLAAEARDWEQHIDDKLGAAVRRVCYDTLLHHKALAISLLGDGAPWYGKPFLSVIYPRLVPMMRKMLTIEPDAVEASKQMIIQTVEELARARGDSLFLVGDTFSRADISAASMLAPLTLAPAYGVPWPRQMPEPLNEFSELLKPRLGWVDALYAEWRPGS